MRYTFNFQLMPDADGRPHDDGEVIMFSEQECDQPHLIPNVDDFVQAVANIGGESIMISGRVKTRYFLYNTWEDSAKKNLNHCHVNMVLEPAEDFDWGKLIKE